MTLYKGKMMGFTYSVEADNEKDLIDIIVESMQNRSPVLVAVMKKLMEQA